MDNKVIIPQFNDIEPAKSPQQASQGGQVNPFTPGGQETIQIGSGFTVYNVDKQGMWMGDPRFFNAPFSVSMSGDLKASKFKNRENLIIADNEGLHSVNNFSVTEVIQTDDQSFTDTTFTPCSSLILVTASLSRPVIALVYISVAGYHDDVDGLLEFQLYLNALPQGQIFVLNQVADPTTSQTKFVIVPVTFNSGNNELLVQGRSSNANSGTLKGSFIPAVLGYILLGK